MAIRLGMNCQAFYGIAGSTANNEMPNVTDVTINMDKAEADATIRGNDGWRATVGTLKEGSVEFEMIWDTDEAGFTAVKNAFFNDTAIALAFFTEDGDGLDADFTITNFSQTQPLEDVVKAQVTAKPTYSTRAPTWSDGGS
jgi:predicted secreted protein